MNKNLAMDGENKHPKFYGVGVGPGDSRFLTLRAVEVLKESQVIAIPKSKMERESIAWEIAKPHCPEDAKILELEMPMTSDDEVLQRAWEKAAKAVMEEISQGNSVAFLTLGDPSLYSTYTYLLNLLKEELTPGQIETVPGITAMSAAAARVNTPLATGDEPLLVIPGSGSLAEYEDFPNLVLMKVSRNLDEILRLVQKEGTEGILATRVGQEGETIRILTRDEELEKVDYLTLVLLKKNKRGESNGK